MAVPSSALDGGDREATWSPRVGRTQVMAILNVTTDSFSGDGLLNLDDPLGAIRESGRRAVAARADVLDVGAASTRPGASPVAADVEMERVARAVSALADTVQVPISIDTFNVGVAAAAIKHGARIINCVWGVRTPSGAWNDPLVKLAKDTGAHLVLMHNRQAAARNGVIGPHYGDVEYDDVVEAVRSDLAAQVSYVVEAGLKSDRLIIDPGIGFGKTPEQNVVLLQNLGRIQSLGVPLLLSASRKSVLGHLLGKDVAERDEATAILSALATAQGVDMVRVHDVARSADAAALAHALRG